MCKILQSYQISLVLNNRYYQDCPPHPIHLQQHKGLGLYSDMFLLL